jgi:DNA-binding NarL/FixJ family response regulator
MRLVLCDGNRILCEALAAILEARGHQVAAIATTPAGGVGAVAVHGPDVVLLDLRRGDSAGGLAAARTIRQYYPGTAVLVLSSLTERAACSAARKAGAGGFLGKDQSVERIVTALEVIAAGGAVFDPAGPGHARPAGGRRPAFPPCALTPREKEVLRRIVAGQSTVRMADEMKITTSTLRTYVKNVLTKTGSHSRLQAAALAARQDLIGDATEQDLAGTPQLA